jgi:CRAL/TRIO domain
LNTHGGEHIRSNVNISACAIVDLSGLTSAHCSSKMLDHLKTLIGIDNVCFPEMLGKMLVINAPSVAVQIWGMVKNWLDPRYGSYDS